MLRVLVLLLLLANGAFFLWSQGHLATWGLAPQDPREPQRLQQQIEPASVRLINAPRDSGASNAPDGDAQLPAESETSGVGTPAQTPPDAALAPPATPAPAVDASSPATSAAPAGVPPVQTPVAVSATEPAALAGQARACWQASGFTEAQADTLQASLALLGLPSGTWQLREQRSPARWLVYLGRYDNTAQLERKRAELQGLKMDARTVTTPGLAPGLSLGGYPTETAARQALQNAQRQGVRTARVALEYAESVSFTLRLPSALPAQRNAVAALGPALAGKTLQACN